MADARLKYEYRNALETISDLEEQLDKQTSRCTELSVQNAAQRLDMKLMEKQIHADKEHLEWLEKKCADIQSREDELSRELRDLKIHLHTRRSPAATPCTDVTSRPLKGEDEQRPQPPDQQHKPTQQPVAQVFETQPTADAKESRGDLETELLIAAFDTMSDILS